MTSAPSADESDARDPPGIGASPRPERPAALWPTVGARFVAVDVCYRPSGSATAACVVAADPAYTTIVAEHTAQLDDIEPYRPGAFFERELPPIAAVLTQAGPVDLLIVDGYVDLDPLGRAGLGAHAHRRFGVPVIGVAKNPFVTATHAMPIRRGTSSKPLYITAAGLPVPAAADLVRHMAGAHRMPTALRRVDQLSRQAR